MDEDLMKQAKEVTDKLTDYLNSFSNKEKNNAFCLAMSNEHRTLQQNFTSLCLKWIAVMGNNDPEFNNELNIKSEEDFCRRLIDPRNNYSHIVCKKLSDYMKEEYINSNLPCI